VVLGVGSVSAEDRLRIHVDTGTTYSLIAVKATDRKTLIYWLKKTPDIKKKEYVLWAQVDFPKEGVEYIARYKTLKDIPRESVPCPNKHDLNECWLIKYEN
jgi:hypothetical protein